MAIRILSALRVESLVDTSYRHIDPRNVVIMLHCYTVNITSTSSTDVPTTINLCLLASTSSSVIKAYWSQKHKFREDQ